MPDRAHATDESVTPRGLATPLIAVICLLPIGLCAGFGLAVGLGMLGDLFASSHQRPAAGQGQAEFVVPASAPLFVGWPAEPPDLALVLSGEMHGYLRPCGCSPDQQGGLARRGGLLQFLRDEKGWTVLPLDLGNVVEKSGKLQQLLYEHALESLGALGYRAVGLGPNDLGLTLLHVIGAGLNIETLKLVQSNLSHQEDSMRQFIEDEKPFERLTLLPNAGPVPVVIGAVMDESAAKSLATQKLSVAASAATAGKLLSDMTAALGKLPNGEAGLKILLAQLTPAKAEALAKSHPGLDLILCASEHEDSATEEARTVGKTLITWVGRKGKSVGVVGFWKKDRQLRFELVALDKRFRGIGRHEGHLRSVRRSDQGRPPDRRDAARRACHRRQIRRRRALRQLSPKGLPQVEHDPARRRAGDARQGRASRSRLQPPMRHLPYDRRRLQQRISVARQDTQARRQPVRELSRTWQPALGRSEQQEVADPYAPQQEPSQGRAFLPAVPRYREQHPFRLRQVLAQDRASVARLNRRATELGADQLIEMLELQPLPGEGGFYRETHRSADRWSAAAPPGRAAATAIYYLLTDQTYSALHRLAGEEVYHFYLGDPVEMFLLDDTGHLERILLGHDLTAAERCQFVVPAGFWQASRLLPAGCWALLGTTMAPGFEPADCQLADRSLLDRWPRHAPTLGPLLPAAP